MSQPNRQPSDLCAICGLCCDGSLFHTVELQPGDSAASLNALGFRIKQKKHRQWFSQPCPAHQHCSCRIYAERPERCRRFSCRQLLRLQHGEISWESACATIDRACSLRDHIRALLLELGLKENGRSLFQRIEAVLNDPDFGLTPTGATHREQLIAWANELESLFSEAFRTRPLSPPTLMSSQDSNTCL